MPQALKPLSIIHIGSWENSPFPLLALWGNRASQLEFVGKWPSFWFSSVEFYCRSLAVNHEWEILHLLPHRPRVTRRPALPSALLAEISLAHFIQWAPRRTSLWTITLFISDSHICLAPSPPLCSCSRSICHLTKGAGQLGFISRAFAAGGWVEPWNVTTCTRESDSVILFQ